MAALLPELTLDDWSYLRAKLIWGYDGPVAADNLSQRSAGGQISAWWLREGRVTIEKGGQPLSAEADDWIFCGASPRQQTFSPGASIVSINFVLEWPSGDSAIEPFFRIPARSQPGLLQTARPVVEFIERRFPGVRVDLGLRSAGLTEFFQLQALFSAWMVAFLETATAAGLSPSRMAGIDPRVLDVLRELDRHPWTERFEEDEVARKAGLSTGHLDRLFMRQLGVSPRGYLQKRRLESATALLADAALPIKKVAYDLGFSSPAHFCHWFRQAMGSSPRDYRQGRQR